MIEYLVDVSAVVVGVILYNCLKNWWDIRKWRNYSNNSYYGDCDDC